MKRFRPQHLLACFDRRLGRMDMTVVSFLSGEAFFRVVSRFHDECLVSRARADREEYERRRKIRKDTSRETSEETLR